MATTRIGIHTPPDLDAEAGPVYSVSLSTGDTVTWEAELSECTDGVGALIGVIGGSGLVTWYRTGSLEEGWEWIDETAAGLD